MGKEDLGEPSSHRFEGNDEERPFKKARYVWEVKGKYHLKEAYKNSKTDSSKEEVPDENDPVEGLNREEHNTETSKLRLNNNNNNCSNRCCIEAILAAQSDVLMDSDDSEDDESSPQKNIDKSISDEIPVTLVKSNPKNQEYYLHRWQARQVAKGFVDNTINRVLENWMTVPFDVADLVENCDNDGHVEDEGIMMAIQSHGLRSGFANSSFENRQDSLQVQCECSGHQSHSKETPVSFMRPQEITESTLDNYENVYNESIKQNVAAASDSDSMSCDDQPSQVDLNNGNLEIDNQVDFLNAAVSVAIQKKGLSSYNYG